MTFYGLFLSFTMPHIHVLFVFCLYQDHTLHFVSQVAENSLISSHTGAQEDCTLPQVSVCILTHRQNF